MGPPRGPGRVPATPTSPKVGAAAWRTWLPKLFEKALGLFRCSTPKGASVGSYATAVVVFTLETNHAGASSGPGVKEKGKGRAPTLDFTEQTVTTLFCESSWGGTPDELAQLVVRAAGGGLKNRPAPGAIRKHRRIRTLVDFTAVFQSDARSKQKVPPSLWSAEGPVALYDPGPFETLYPVKP